MSAIGVLLYLAIGSFYAWHLDARFGDYRSTASQIAFWILNWIWMLPYEVFQRAIYYPLRDRRRARRAARPTSPGGTET